MRHTFPSRAAGEPLATLATRRVRGAPGPARTTAPRLARVARRAVQTSLSAANPGRAGVGRSWPPGARPGPRFLRRFFPPGAKPRPRARGPDGNDLHVDRVGGERCEIAWIRSQDRSARFGQSDDERVHGRAPAGATAEHGRPSGKQLRNLLENIAGLEQAMLVCIPAGLPLKTL